MQRHLKSFAALPDRQAPSFRSAALKTHAQLPLPIHRAPEIERGKQIHNETEKKVLRVLEGEGPNKEVA